MLEFFNQELLLLIISYLQPKDMLELRLTLTRYHSTLEEIARLELCRNLGWLEVLPSWLQGPFNISFTKYFSVACCWL